MLKLTTSSHLKITYLAAAICLCACSATQLLPESSSVIVSSKRPAANCKFITKLMGNQGNVVSGQMTSDSNLYEGALNDLRNQAYKAGANYVKLVNTKNKGVTNVNSSNERTYKRGDFTDDYDYRRDSNTSTKMYKTRVGTYMYGDAYICPAN